VIYYAHSLYMYDTEEEERELKVLASKFPKEKIYNPKGKFVGMPNAEIMYNCMKIIEGDLISALAFSTYLDHIGRGVYDEICKAIEFGKPVFRITERNKVNTFTGRLVIVDESDWKIRYAKVGR
jgi:hypothetical protein